MSYFFPILFLVFSLFHFSAAQTRGIFNLFLLKDKAQNKILQDRGVISKSAFEAQLAKEYEKWARKELAKKGYELVDFSAEWSRMQNSYEASLIPLMTVRNIDGKIIKIEANAFSEHQAEYDLSNLITGKIPSSDTFKLPDMAGFIFVHNMKKLEEADINVNDITHNIDAQLAKNGLNFDFSFWANNIEVPEFEGMFLIGVPNGKWGYVWLDFKSPEDFESMIKMLELVERYSLAQRQDMDRYLDASARAAYEKEKLEMDKKVFGRDLVEQKHRLDKLREQIQDQDNARLYFAIETTERGLDGAIEKGDINEAKRLQKELRDLKKSQEQNKLLLNQIRQEQKAIDGTFNERVEKIKNTYPIRD